MIWSPLLMKYHDGIVFQAANATVSRMHLWSGPLRCPESGRHVRGKIVGEVVDEDVLPQVEVGVTRWSAGIRKFLEEFAVGFRLSTESDPLSEPLVSPTSGAAAST